MFDTAGLEKTFPDLAFEGRAVVGFDNVRISIDAEYFVHDLNNLFSSSTVAKREYSSVMTMKY